MLWRVRNNPRSHFQFEEFVGDAMYNFLIQLRGKESSKLASNVSSLGSGVDRIITFHLRPASARCHQFFILNIQQVIFQRDYWQSRTSNIGEAKWHRQPNGGPRRDLRSLRFIAAIVIYKFSFHPFSASHPTQSHRMEPTPEPEWRINDENTTEEKFFFPFFSVKFELHMASRCGCSQE